MKETQPVGKTAKRKPVRSIKKVKKENTFWQAIVADKVKFALFWVFIMVQSLVIYGITYTAITQDKSLGLTVVELSGMVIQVTIGYLFGRMSVESEKHG